MKRFLLFALAVFAAVAAHAEIFSGDMATNSAAAITTNAQVLIHFPDAGTGSDAQVAIYDFLTAMEQFPNWINGGGGGGGAGTNGALITTNTSTIWVDSVAGNDATARRGREDLPWQSITNAIKVAQSGDTIVVRGTHNLLAVPLIGGAYQTTLNIANLTNVTVIGNSAVLNFTGNGSGIAVSNVTGLRMSGLTIVGDRSNPSGLTYLTAAIAFEGTNSDVEISGCRIVNWMDQGISIGTGNDVFDTKRLKIFHNYFEAIGTDLQSSLGQADGTCISGLIGAGTWISENYATNIVRFAEFENAGNTAPQGTSQDIYILNNIADYVYSWGIFVGGQTNYQAGNVHIEGNSIRMTGRAPNPKASTGIVVLNATNCWIRNNTVVGVDTGYGANTSIGVLNQGGNTNISDWVVIEGNKIQDQRSTNGAGYAIAVQCDRMTNTYLHAIIRNNILDNCPLGIACGAYDTLCEGNVIRNETVDFASAFIAVNGHDIGNNFSGNCTNLVLRNNSFVSGASTPNQTFIWMHGTTNAVTVYLLNNWIQGVAAANYAGGEGTIANLYWDHSDTFSPAGLIRGSVGSRWMNRSGSAGATLYVKETGSSTSGWIPANNATSLTGIIPPANLGTGTPTAGTVLFGDSTWRTNTAGSGNGFPLQGDGDGNQKSITNLLSLKTAGPGGGLVVGNPTTGADGITNYGQYYQTNITNAATVLISPKAHIDTTDELGSSFSTGTNRISFNMTNGASAGVTNGSLTVSGGVLAKGGSNVFVKTVDLEQELRVSGSAGTAGQALVSQGPGLPPQYSTIGGGGGGGWTGNPTQFSVSNGQTNIKSGADITNEFAHVTGMAQSGMFNVEGEFAGTVITLLSFGESPADGTFVFVPHITGYMALTNIDAGGGGGGTRFSTNRIEAWSNGAPADVIIGQSQGVHATGNLIADGQFTGNGTGLTNIVQIQAYTNTVANAGTTNTAYVWTKPAGAKLVHVIAIGGGGGGGSGRRDAAGAYGRFAGAGGAPGNYSDAWLPAAILGSTETVLVGYGGAGGAGQTSDTSNGINGTGGGVSQFGTNTAWCSAGGGGGGGGGTSSASVGGVVDTTHGVTFAGAAGAAGNTNTSGTSASSSPMAPGPGGGGGGINTSDAAQSGGLGGNSRGPGAQVGGGAGGSANANAGNGTSCPVGTWYGGGGGGGGGGGTTTAGIGGNGGLYGAGGGGGGASANGITSGKGGDAASGVVVVITIF